ncbi:260bea8b-f23d-4df5-8498-f2389cc8e0c8-CDS [Sclerotinia trifoliorum]|uniref:260bea8b-f23d-4df5-8498-f2389cc8e0c8-CDS n=1 Tax=Sclerotinia trifoliorum TaxID=28548 RepID=A0A8H2ZRK6_9HELO|nr:260bea8b-f23d-4df5-8498-f2389cc8e0c8-CDS [Sclerotinia trifoliorum]
MWDSFRDLRYPLPDGLFTEELLKNSLKQLLLALDYIHTECKLVHTDIKADNIFSQIEDKSILDAFTNAEMRNPSPRKSINGVTVHTSRQLEIPKFFGDSVLSDFGSAAPEVMIKAAWTYPVDIWNVGVMVWDLFEGEHMFYGNDPDGKGYSTRAHLAEVIGMLGPPPLDPVKRDVRSPEFFDEEGKWIAEIPIMEDKSLEKSELRLRGKNKDMFLELMRGMLQWRPEDRKTGRELIDDPWLTQVVE